MLEMFCLGGMKPLLNLGYIGGVGIDLISDYFHSFLSIQFLLHAPEVDKFIVDKSVIGSQTVENNGTNHHMWQLFGLSIQWNKSL